MCRSFLPLTAHPNKLARQCFDLKFSAAYGTAGKVGFEQFPLAAAERVVNSSRNVFLILPALHVTLTQCCNKVIR